MATVMAIHTTSPSRSGEQIHWSKIIRTKYSAGEQPQPLSRNQICFMDFFWPIRFNGRNGGLRENPMKKLVFAILLIASPAWAQTKLLPKSVTARADPCAPIGRTADGKLVYSMKCENLPAPPSPPPQAEVSPPPAPEPEVQRSGFFGLSYERKRPGE
jgi:hypothetical protein